jgi:nitrite reductase/ring-hydroxylating ferredoxin subunit
MNYELSPFLEIAAIEEIPQDGVRCFELEGRRIAVIRTGDGIFATDDRCPHRGGPLGEGTVEEGALVCPWHFWRFDPSSGRHIEGSKFALVTHEVRVENGRVLVRLSPRTGNPG